jgi:hypothetical protein
MQPLLLCVGYLSFIIILRTWSLVSPPLTQTVSSQEHFDITGLSHAAWITISSAESTQCINNVQKRYCPCSDTNIVSPQARALTTHSIANTLVTFLLHVSAQSARDRTISSPLPHEISIFSTPGIGPERHAWPRSIYIIKTFLCTVPRRII